MSVEVKIGVENSPRELSIETPLSSTEVITQLQQAIADGAIFTLADEKGATVAVPAGKVAYLNFAAETGRKVGFGQVLV